IDIENQEGSFDMKNPPSIENLFIIEKDDLISMKDIVIIENMRQQNWNIANYNKQCKTIALNILKYLSENILYEEPVFLMIKLNNVTILDNGLCTYCKKSILSDNSFRSVVIHVYGHIHHQTCAKEINKKRAISCNTCHIRDDSNMLILTTQTKKCTKCFVEISTEPSELVVLLPCTHMVHFEYINNNKCKLYPECLTDYELKKESYYVLSEMPRKRRRQEDEHRSTRDTKVQTIICRLTVFTLDELSISALS
ncbi:8889_t:CDS:1, partial [Cetraspora pellucida]